MTRNVLDTIGRTPLVPLTKVVTRGMASVFVKLEYFNPTGSYKDRMAKAMIQGAERRGELRPKESVVEYSGGSTGSSLALVCAVKGYSLKIVSSDAFAQEKLATMRALGAEVILIPSEGGAITPDLVPRMREAARRIHEQEGAFWTNQFQNHDALEGYAGIGREVFVQLDGAPNAFCGAVGTAGMLSGVSAELKKHGTRIVALEPAESPVLTRGSSGAHQVEGVGVGFVPPLLDEELYDEAMAIPEAAARSMAKRLAREEGILAGTSTGLNVCGALELARKLGPGKKVVTVAVDSGLKYLSGSLYR